MGVDAAPVAASARAGISGRPSLGAVSDAAAAWGSAQHHRRVRRLTAVVFETLDEVTVAERRQHSEASMAKLYEPFHP